MNRRQEIEIEIDNFSDWRRKNYGYKEIVAHVKYSEYLI